MKISTILSILIVILLFGCSVSEEIEEKSESTCSEQGMMQSDLNYCIELCLLDKNDALIH